MRTRLYLCAVILLALLSRTEAHAQVRVWQGTLTLPTYEESAPDPNPPFDQFTSNKFNYPYVLRENLTSKRANHDWRAIYLENEYLKCSVLPDIGGHLYTCVDKLSGQSMFYDNTSIKKAVIGYRGAWAAFGIEFNFPVSHNWVSMSPVNFSFRTNSDGSASVFVGNIDRVYGMEWQVELLLRPKSTLLEERVTLSNRSDVRHRFYWWNNAAARVSDDSHIVYPMRYAASHGFTEVRPWPLDPDGNDLSIIRNHTHGAVSYFTHGSREDFMGVWHPATKTGTVHFAEYEQLPAKKIWSWGVDAEGLDWRKALSDDNSGYIEIQAGLFRNQETYAFLEPRQSLHFSEYWMPVRGLEGISRANLAGVLSLTRRDGKLIVGFNANRPLSNATITISGDKKNLFNEKVELAPEHVWARELPVYDSQAKYTVEIRDAQDAVQIRQTEGVYDWTPQSEIHVGPQTSYRIPEAEQRNADDWLQLGKDMELNGKLLQAFDTYKEALRKFPNDFAVQKAIGRLAAALLRFDEAKNFLEAVHARDTSDPEISYYLGIADEELGETQQARIALEAAQRSASFRAAAALRLGEMLAREGDLARAQRHLEEAYHAAPDDLRVVEELAAVKHASAHADEAKNLIKEEAYRFPFSYFLLEELGSPDLQQLGNDATRVLNVATQYMRLGLYRQALRVLSQNYPAVQPDETEPGALPPNQNPMVAYFRGYCRERLGESSSADYIAASKLSAAYVFPSTAEEFAVLRAAVKSNSQDATAHYLLGTFYFSRGLTEPALAEWTLAREVNANIPVLDASLGLALLHEKHDAEKALEVFREGIHADAGNVTIYLGADQALSLLKKSSNERVQVLEKYPDMANAPAGLVFELILNLAEAGDFERAEALFHNRFFPREEGGTNVRQVWVEVRLQQLLALAKEKKCGEALPLARKLGNPVDGLAFTQDGLEPMLNAARTKYLLGTVYADCGQAEEANDKFKEASAATSPEQVFWASLAAKRLSGFDEKQWQEKLQSSLAQAESRSESSGFATWWYYNTGMLATALGKEQLAEAKFQRALLLPDRMLAYHLTRLARSQAMQ